ncbi:phage tail protein [Mucilaginibacter sp. E4BP6]|uniref:phage tail protein n=1 Tax=Mucilaginibacter sp. E4BP6 TaxID=2723089 RepID=UPI0015C85284|nr:tail fiber protein [Mucilaginibacter sp. E4BP6]NYE68248.1 microcystin-dependent protein [Mucilaginibacter sp. E4BP6]
MNYYLGEIIAYAGNYVPQYFQLCDGSMLNINEYQALYTLLGTTYGGGAGTFAVPNLKSIVVVGTDSGTSYPLAATGGATTVTLAEANLPVHTHALNASTAAATAASPAGAFLAASNSPTGYPNVSAYSAPPATPSTISGILNAASINNTGGSAPHDNMMPYLTINYMICTQGLFPTS